MTPLSYPVQAANVTTYSDWAEGQIGKTVALARDTWITVEPEVQQACRTLPQADMVERLYQLLGLKPATPQDAPKVVQLTIAEPQPIGPTGKGIFRPCADPDPTATPPHLSQQQPQPLRVGVVINPTLPYPIHTL